jgi:hypothetical protein
MYCKLRSFSINSNQKKLNQKKKKKKTRRPSMAHLGPTMGGVKISPPQLPTPSGRAARLQKLTPPPLRLPRVVVRPPASPNRPPSAVYRTDGAVSRPAAGSIRSPPRTSGKPRLVRGKPPWRRYVSPPS